MKWSEIIGLEYSIVRFCHDQPQPNFKQYLQELPTYLPKMAVSHYIMSRHLQWKLLIVFARAKREWMQAISQLSLMTVLLMCLFCHCLWCVMDVSAMWCIWNLALITWHECHWYADETTVWDRKESAPALLLHTIPGIFKTIGGAVLLGSTKIKMIQINNLMLMTKMNPYIDTFFLCFGLTQLHQPPLWDTTIY